MLTEKCFKDCVKLHRKKLGIRQFFQYLSNDAKIRDRSIVVQIIVIKTHLVDHRCDKS